LGGHALNASITSDMFDYYFRPGREEKLRLFAEHGFEHLHWCDDWNADVFYTRGEMELYRRLIESAGFRCIDVHGTATEAIRIDTSDEALLERYLVLLENRVEFCYAIGGDAVVIHPPGVEEVGLSLRLERSKRVLDGVRPLCEELGVSLAVENVYRSDEKILEYYFEAYPPEYVGFCFDSGHANVNGNLKRLYGFGGRLRALHLHDNRGERDDHQPPFWGTLDWGEVMGWIRDSRYRKPINFEITHNPEFYGGTMEGFLGLAVRSVRKALALHS